MAGTIRRRIRSVKPAVRTPNGPCCEENCWREAYSGGRCKYHHDLHVYKEGLVA